MVTMPDCAISDEITVFDYAECEIPARLEAVRLAVDKMRAFCARHGLENERWSEVELGVVEGLNNAVEHGCAGKPDAAVQFRWSWRDETLEVRITDPGHYLPDPAVQPELPEDLLAESGRGSYLMRAMMDDVVHALGGDGRHMLTLRKRVGLKIEPKAEPDAETAVLVQTMVEELSANYDSLSALFRFAEKLATASTFEEFTKDASEHLLELMEGTECHLLLQNAALGTLERVHSRRADPERLLEPRLSVGAVFVESRVFRENRQSTVENCARLPRGDPLQRPGQCAYVCPVRFQADVLGVFSLLRSRAKGYFSAGEIGVMRAVTEFIGIARATATFKGHRVDQQKADRELEIAARIQQSLLPRSFPNSPKRRFFGVSHASLEVGGDFFDVIPIKGKGELLAIADVMGKGIPAALLATILRTTIRARRELATTPDLLLTEVNRLMQADLTRLEMFITAQVTFVADNSSQLVFASAGHCPILKYSPRDGSVEQIQEGSVPLGVLPGVLYSSYRAEVLPGQRFVFLTDGVYEAEGRDGKMLGMEEVARQVRVLSAETPAGFCERLLDLARNYSRPDRPSDDRTLLVMDAL